MAQLWYFQLRHVAMSRTPLCPEIVQSIGALALKEYHTCWSAHWLLLGDLELRPEGRRSGPHSSEGGGGSPSAQIARGRRAGRSSRSPARRTTRSARQLSTIAAGEKLALWIGGDKGKSLGRVEEINGPSQMRSILQGSGGVLCNVFSSVKNAAQTHETGDLIAVSTFQHAFWLFSTQLHHKYTEKKTADETQSDNIRCLWLTRAKVKF